MTNQEKILVNFICYVICGCIICLIGMTGVFAQVISYRFFGQSVNGTFGISSGSSSTANTYINVTADSTAKYLVVDLCSTVGTSITTSIPSDYDGSYTQFYKMYDLKSTCSTGSYNGSSIRIFYLINTWADSGNGNQAINNTTKITNNASYYGSFKLISVGLSDTIDLGDLTVNNQATIINGINGLNSSISSSQSSITNSITSSQSTITNAIQDTEDNIISSQEQTRDAIIQNDTDNTDRLIEDNKNTYQTCHDSVNLVNFNTGSGTSNGITYNYNNGLLTLNGTATANVFISVIIDTISSGSTVSISANNSSINSNIQLRLYDTNTGNNSLSAVLSSVNSKKENIITTSDFNRFQIRIASGTTLSNFTLKPQLEKGSIATDFEPYGEEICTNKLDEANETSKGILGKLGELITNLFDTSGPDTDGLSGMAGWLPAGPVDSIINLPLTFLNNLTTSIGSSCTAVSVPLPFVINTLSLPCFTTIISSINGASTLWTFIGTISTCLLLYYYLKSLYKWIDNKLALNEDTDWGGI